MNKGFTVSAQITAARPLADRSVSITVHTKELPKDEVSLIVDTFQNNPVGWLLFKENDIQVEEIPEVDSDFQAKSQSQRIRGCLYRLWEQRGSQGTFETFYKEQTEKIITYIKSKLE